MLRKTFRAIVNTMSTVPAESYESAKNILGNFMCIVLVILVLGGLGVGIYFLISSGVLSGDGKKSSPSSFLGETSFVEIVETVVQKVEVRRG